MNKFAKRIVSIFIIMVIFSSFTHAFSSTVTSDEDFGNYIEKAMKKGNIPGLSVVTVTGDQTTITNYGYANTKEQIKVTEMTKFELASCSKAFTALAIAKLNEEGTISLSDSVSTYLPWFSVRYDNIKEPITIKQALYHTTGIPVTTISNFTQNTSDTAIKDAVLSLVDMSLERRPGSEFEYATINYDILGAIIEEVTDMRYEDYMVEEIFKPLGLNHTTVGIELEDQEKAVGHKISFFKARPFVSPAFRGNYPAGYVISNSQDMAQWLKIQMGTKKNEFSSLIEKTHIPDRSVLPNPNDLSSYAFGWEVHQNDIEEISHDGINPNFSSYVAFSKKNQKGVAILANSNSSYTSVIGQYVMMQLNGEKDMVLNEPNAIVDRACSVVSIILLSLIIAEIVFLFIFSSEVLKKHREFEGLSIKKVKKLLLVSIICLPYIFAVYILPSALAKSNWETIVIWTPKTFVASIVLMGILVGATIMIYGLLQIFPHKNKYKKELPSLAALSLISGVANAIIIFLITNAVNSNVELKYLVFYFTLILFIYIYGRKIVETRLVEITQSIIYDLRMNMFERLFGASYQDFEKIDSGQILTTINNDAEQISQSANLFVTLITSLVTIICVFVYLGTLSLMATLMSLFVIVMIAGIYYVVVKSSRTHWEEARDTQNAFMEKVEGLIKGFKELTMHFKKKSAYMKEVSSISSEFRDKTTLGRKNFVNSFLVGESLFIVVLGTIGFGFPILFPSVTAAVLISFIIVLLYILGPINAILRITPQIIQIDIARKRIVKLTNEIPVRVAEVESIVESSGAIDSLIVDNVIFKYDGGEGGKKFEVGPINLEVFAGEILFLIGGNGSGKTTLAKLLTGLYAPIEGSIKINGRTMKAGEIGEYISVIFSDFHLFKRLYDVDCSKKEVEINHYLKLLNLEEKVEIKDGCFSTTDLSTGQKKRLALLRCYLEDRPIYLFDELAADQDPQFRKIFYRDLLPKMRDEGKIVIAITHDDHYFDVADKILKMDMGKVEVVDTSYSSHNTIC
jgi:cyclic peptide transporter